VSKTEGMRLGSSLYKCHNLFIFVKERTKGKKEKGVVTHPLAFLSSCREGRMEK